MKITILASNLALLIVGCGEEIELERAKRLANEMLFLRTTLD
tara:strand:+ start:205 stop:330 length:126 start_codon:yes stop_codon:yes gene_type:complete